MIDHLRTHRRFAIMQLVFSLMFFGCVCIAAVNQPAGDWDKEEAKKEVKIEPKVQLTQLSE